MSSKLKKDVEESNQTPDAKDYGNIELVKYNFTIKQLLIIGSFLGTTAVTIGYAAFSYYKTIDSVQQIRTQNDIIKIQIDTLFQRTNALKEQARAQYEKTIEILKK